MKIGILGGTFNPIHIGHLIIAEEVYNVHNLSKIVFIPVNHPPHKDVNKLVDSSHRYQMVKEAINKFNYFEVSDVEIKRKGKSFTIDTIKILQEQYGPDSDLFLIIGADSLNELNTWKEIKLLTEMCKFVVVNRPEYDITDLQHLENIFDKNTVSGIKNRMVQIPPVGISSSDIRERIKNGNSIQFWTPDPVNNYIKQHKLYL